MSLEAIQNLSIPELLRALNERLGLECTGLQRYHPPVIRTTSLETEIESLETGAREALGIIASLRNLLQPINRLPPEILSRVARLFITGVANKDARRVVPLTHVCRYWRGSIISDPTNWSRISDRSEGLTALSLERAREAPLEVSLKVDTEGTASCRLLTPHLWNIVTLRLTCNTTIDNLRETIPDFPRSMPNLRSLRLKSDPQWDHSIDPFESLAPTLKYLELRNIPLYPSILCLKSLTELTYINSRPHNKLHLDTVLDFLEENHSLSRVALGINFGGAPLRSSRRQAAVENKLQYLSIACEEGTDGQALISRIALRRGAHLNITYDSNSELEKILSGVSTTHLQNLRSPTFMEFRSYEGKILLTGPNGRFSFQLNPIYYDWFGSDVDPFQLGSPLPLSLSHIKKLRYACHTDPVVFDQTPFPALEILALECESSVSYILSSLFSNPSSPLSLKTIAFLNCNLHEGFMGELTRYASNRKGTTSAWLHQVVIINSDGVFPSMTSIRGLMEHVPVVEVKVGTKFPKDL